MSFATQRKAVSQQTEGIITIYCVKHEAAEISEKMLRRLEVLDGGGYYNLGFTDAPKK